MRRLPVLLPLLAATLLLITLMPFDGDTVSGQGVGAGTISRAGIVVLHGDGSRTDAVVAFEGDEISGVDLLRGSGIDFLSVPFGGLGEGICQIEREGCEVTECRRTVCQATRDAPYWQLFDRVADDGSWASARLGASAARVSDGQVVVWAWTSEPIDLPTLNLPAVADAAGLGEDALATFGAEGPVAIVDSGYDPDDATTGTVAGIVGLLTIGFVGGLILILRRFRIAR